ncbi:MAG: BadF/BadG/BcrA/BcrD ATPase family protein [Clostridia bacterium]|nr:BadF/BadG/BcrA/BcrD ATPase family protein [Clostridia bacterium]
MSMDDQLFLGFDGGQSGSRAVLVDGAGHIVETASGPAFDHLNAVGGVDKIRRAFGACLEVPGIRNAAVKSAFFGLTGLCSPEAPESGPLREILGQCFTAGLVVLDNDSVSCWAGALGGEPGVVVAAGTGVVAYGEKARGLHAARLSGWGNIMGDLGGAYDIGRKALQKVTAAEDMGDDCSSLKQRVLEHFGLPDLRSLQALLYQSESKVGLVAQCSKVVGCGAQTGDPVCVEILQNAGCELGRLAVRTAEVLGWSDDDAVEFSMAGGVFNAGPALVESYVETICRAYPKAAVKAPMFEPVIGAALMALSQAGVETVRVHGLTSVRSEWGKRNEAWGV